MATLDGDPATLVPSCPGWSLTDLVAHVGSYHRWAADLIQDASPQPRAPYALRPDPHTPLAEWYRTSLELLLKAVDTTDPDTPMWTGRAPHPTSPSLGQLRYAARGSRQNRRRCGCGD
jgi:uncharacterized protein (TIGR03083 family)